MPRCLYHDCPLPCRHCVREADDQGLKWIVLDELPWKGGGVMGRRRDHETSRKEGGS